MSREQTPLLAGGKGGFTIEAPYLVSYRSSKAFILVTVCLALFTVLFLREQPSQEINANGSTGLLHLWRRTFEVLESCKYPLLIRRKLVPVLPFMLKSRCHVHDGTGIVADVH